MNQSIQIIHKGRITFITASYQKIAVLFVIFYLFPIIINNPSLADNKSWIDKATVRSDKLTVFSRMSLKSRKVTELIKDEKVFVNFEMFGPGSDRVGLKKSDRVISEEAVPIW